MEEQPRDTPFTKSTKEENEPSTPSSDRRVDVALRGGDLSPDKVNYVTLNVAGAAYAGPMPPPHLLREYAEISSDLPHRMMAMAEKAQADAHQHNGAQLRAAVEDMRENWRVIRAGQICGLLVAIFALATGVIALKISPNAVGATMGTIIGGGGVAALIWAFRYDRKDEATGDEMLGKPPVTPKSSKEP